MTQSGLTVLVVGAGANADFRLKDEKKSEEEKIATPTGEQLVEKIADWEGSVLPNLYWGFIKKLAKSCEATEDKSKKIASYFLENFGSSRTSIPYPPERGGEFLKIELTNLSDERVAVALINKLGLENINLLHVDKNNVLNSAVEQIKEDDEFQRYHKISEIVKHYQPFSIDEMLDSIKVGKIDVSKWTGKTENDENERKELIKAGKDLIALFLLQSEDKKVFDYESICWYRHLRNAIITCGKTTGEIKEKLKNFVIISFNYDRSLDYFLRTRVSEFYDKIRVIYPYGSLAENDIWDSQKKDYQKLPYGAAKKTDSSQKRWENFQKARELAADLKVIGELGGEDTKEIKKVITSFGRIYFLGFAFHEENCRVLGMEDDAFKNRLRDLRGKSVNDIFYTNLYSSLKIKSGFDSIFNRARADSFELGKTSQKGSGTYDALSQDFDFRLTKPTR